LTNTYEQQTLSGFRATKDWYSTRDISEIFGVSQETVRNWVKSGRMRGEMHEPITRGAKGDRGRYRIYGDGIEDVALRREELIVASMRYWPMLLAKMRS
jgi:Helix-turn-helix domain